MRKIFFLCLSMLIFLVSHAQNRDTTKYYQSRDYGWQWAAGKFDSSLIFPKDTVRNKRGVVAIGTTIYIGNGSYWTASSGGSTSTASAPVRISGGVISTDTGRSNQVLITGYNLNKVRDSVAAIRRVDSVWITNDTLHVLKEGLQLDYKIPGGSGTSGWGFNGNAINSNDGSKFIGTTDVSPLYFKQNNVQAGMISSDTTAFGQGAQAGIASASFGANAQSVLYSVAAGSVAQASDHSVAVGFSAGANVTGGTAVGYQSSAGGYGVAVGYQAQASQDNSISIGNNALTTAANSVAIGWFNGIHHSVTDYSLILGDTATFSGGVAQMAYNVGIGVLDPVKRLHLTAYNMATGLDDYIRIERLKLHTGSTQKVMVIDPSTGDVGYTNTALGGGGSSISFPFTTLKYPTGYNTFGSFKDTVLATVLAGYSSTTGTLSTSDNIQAAIGKLNGNIGLKLNISDTTAMLANYPLKDGTRTTSWSVNGPITATSANVTGNLQWRGNAATSVDSIVGIVAGSNQLRTVPITQVSIVSVNTESAIASYNGSASVIVSADPSYPGIYYYSTGTFTPTAHFVIAATGIGTGYWLYRYTPYSGLSGLPTTLAGYGITDATKFKTVASYALMIADGTPSVATLYEVITDENKSYSRSTYIWKPNGNREWIASTTDN